MRRKLIFVLLVFACSLLILAGCADKTNDVTSAVTDKVTDKVNDETANKITEEAAEKMLEDASNGTQSVEKTWPKDKVGVLPQPNAKIDFVFLDELNGSYTIEVIEFKNDDFQNYMNKVKSVGYSTDMEMTNEGIYRFSGKHIDKTQVMITYVEDDEKAIIMYIFAE